MTRLNRYAVTVHIGDQRETVRVFAADEGKAKSAAMLETTLRANGRLVTYDVVLIWDASDPAYAPRPLSMKRSK